MADADAAWFEALYREHFRAILGYSLARLEPERARDATAETFLIAWRRLGDVPVEPAAWLFGVARKVVAEQLRADSRRDALTARLARLRAGPGATADPADQVADRELALIALGSLPDADKELLMLVAWDALPAAVAAEVLGLSRLAFAVRLHRARRRLASALAAADAIRTDPATRRVLTNSSQPAERHADASTNGA